MSTRSPIADIPTDALLLGRMQMPQGPTPILVRDGRLLDVAAVAPTVSGLLESASSADRWGGEDIGTWDDFKFTPAWTSARDSFLLSPIDLQCVKAAGVTFAASALERVIEERARGDSAQADEMRRNAAAHGDRDIRQVKPGSDEARRLKEVLIAENRWSQYLEVAIGPDAEIFTKAPVLSSVGWGQDVGVRADSEWNNPEPEVVLICDSRGIPVGATLGNDVNLRDFEGRSALLLGKAKDNNASCAIGPFIRLFDDRFGLDDVRQAIVTLSVTGADGFSMAGESSMRLISRDPLDLIAQTIGDNHQYPDGFALFLGTMFAPTQDRDGRGQGFTHKPGDIVTVSSSQLGTLENRVVHCKDAPPWSFGISALIGNLATRGLIGGHRSGTIVPANASHR